VGLVIWVAGCARDPGPLRDAAGALAEGRTQDAYRSAVAAAAALPESPDAHVLLAEAALLTMRTTDGVAASERALELAPDDPRAHVVRAFLDQARFRNVAAIAAAREAVRLAPDEPRYRIALGELLFGGGMVGTPDYDGAAAAFREALRLEPDAARARFGLAKSLILAGEDEEGEREIGRYLEQRHGHGEAYYLRGLARLRRRALGEAVADFRDAAAYAPHESAHHFNLQRVLQLLGREQEASDARKRFQHFRGLEKGVAGTAVAYHSDTGNVGAALQLARLLAEQGRFRECTILLESLCLDHPNLLEAHALLAEVCVPWHEISSGREAALRVIEMAPGKARGYLALARLESEAGNAVAAVKPAQTAASLEPGDVEVQLLLGSILLDAGKFDEALALFERLRRQFPENLRARGGFGQALVGVGRHEQGVSALTDVLRSRPRHIAWLYYRGLGQIGRGNPGLAEGDLRSVVAIDPAHAEARAGLVRVFRETGREREAQKLEAKHQERLGLETEIRELREQGSRTHHLADLLEKAGRPAEAVRVRADADVPSLLP
jgi:tetratricopeptide (TPR) repeat protein